MITRRRGVILRVAIIVRTRICDNSNDSTGVFLVWGSGCAVEALEMRGMCKSGEGSCFERKLRGIN